MRTIYIMVICAIICGLGFTAVIFSHGQDRTFLLGAFFMCFGAGGFLVAMDAADRKA